MVVKLSHPIRKVGLVRTAYKCRAYPTPEQAALLSRTFGCVRVVWNRTLAWRSERYRSEGANTSFTKANAHLTALKAEEDMSWLNEVSCVPLQQTLRHQQVAFSNFFAQRARHPRFPLCHIDDCRSGRQSAEFTRSGFRFRNGELFLAKNQAPLQFVWSWPDIDLDTIDPRTVTVSRDPDGRWHVSLAVEVNAPTPLPRTGSAVGIDLGVTSFAVTSNGETIANPRHLERKAKNLARYQRRMARCQKGSANRNKASIKVARAHRKVRAARSDFLHRTSTNLVRKHDVIALEDLAVKNMVKNHRLAKAISDCGWGTFRHMLEYKAARAGRQVIVVDRWYPSSKTCSHCGHVLDKLPLGVRQWTCPQCSSRHDRDVNAAKNIVAAGLAAHTGEVRVYACGGDVRHSESSRVQLPAKQEPQRVTAGIPVF